MARYIAKERGQIPADEVRPSKRADASPNRKVMRIVEKGEEFTFYGKPGSWMEPVKGAVSQTEQGGQGNQPNSRSTKAGKSGQTEQGGSPALQPPGNGGGSTSP